MKTWLLERNFARGSEGAVYFRHDTIRDFLASRRFLDAWRDILHDEKTTVVKAWLPMLRFALMEIVSWETRKAAGLLEPGARTSEDRNAARGMLLHAILMRDIDVAMLAFKAWRSQRGETPEAWEKAFTDRYGELAADR